MTTFPIGQTVIADMNNYALVELSSVDAALDTIELARGQLGKTFPVTEAMSVVFQRVPAFERRGACDEYLDYTPGFLTYGQLQAGAEYSFRTGGTDMFCVKDYGSGRGICIRCEHI